MTLNPYEPPRIATASSYWRRVLMSLLAMASGLTVIVLVLLSAAAAGYAAAVGFYLAAAALQLGDAGRLLFFSGVVGLAVFTAIVVLIAALIFRWLDRTLGWGTMPRCSGEESAEDG